MMKIFCVSSIGTARFDLCAKSGFGKLEGAHTGRLFRLLKNVWQNHAEHEQLCFFEWGRVWHKDQEHIIEQKQLAGIRYNQKQPISFYDIQSLVEQVAHMIRLPLTWAKVDNLVNRGFAPYQTARMMYGDICVGTVGVLDVACTHRIVRVIWQHCDRRRLLG